MITCPEHGLELSIYGKFLKVNGEIKNVVMGKCPKCKVVYVNQVLSSSGLEFQIGGTTYKYLPALNAHYRPQEIIAPTAYEHPERNHLRNAAKPADNNGNNKVYVLQRIPILDSPDADCMFCGRPLRSTVCVRYPSCSPEGITKEYECSLWECPDCHAVFASDSQMRQIRQGKTRERIETVHASNFLTATQMMEAASQQKIRQKKTGDDRTDLVLKNWPATAKKHPDQMLRNNYDNLSQGDCVVQVYARKCHCQKCEMKFSVNTIENRTALINTVNGEVIKINVMYCKGCGKYYVNLSVLKQYEEIYGGLLAEFRFDSDVVSEEVSRFHFAPDTILSRCGYTVKSGVSIQYRHNVLAYLLDSGKAQKHEIIEKINSFIRVREHNPVYDDACRRWQEDIQFVSNYHIDRQKFVEGLKLQTHPVKHRK